jgi:hypothetical protein
MSEALWLTAAGALSLAGMAWLALAMDVHWGQVMHRSAPAPAPAPAAARLRPVLRTLGAAALALALAACLKADRPSMAVLVWVMLLAGSAVTVALLLARQPALLRVMFPLRLRDSP